MVAMINRQCHSIARLPQPALWPAYRGHPQDTVAVDIFEHWLKAIDHA